MRTSPTRKQAITAAIAGAAAPAMLFLGAGTAQAIQDVSERGAIAIIAELPTPRVCGGCAGVDLDPLPEPPHFPNPDGEAGIGNPNDRVSLGGPDTKFNPPPGLNPSDSSHASTEGAK
jgi:hypothetical protein